MLKYLSFVFLFLLSGCINFKQQEPPTEQEVIDKVDINAIKTTEKSYKISEETTVKVYDDNTEKNIKYNSDWFIVHKDLLKQCNENQNYIIENSENLKKTKKNFQIKMIVISVLLFIISVLLLFLIGKKCQNK